jgi:hypothetical protein
VSDTKFRTLTAFEGFERLASGSLATVREAVLAAEKRAPSAAILVFDNETGEQIDLDLRTSWDAAEPVAPDDSAEVRRAGRPRLGVIGREVTLLPRHWDWLASQKGGASVALRRLVDEARKASEAKDIGRKQQEAAYHFMSAIAGNLPGFEEAARALFADNTEAFAAISASWPRDIGSFARQLATGEAMVT